MSQKSRATLQSDIAALLGDNTTGLISPAKVRQIAADLADSCYNAQTDITEVGFGVDGGGSVITTGLRVKRVMSYACTITGWSIVADQSGSISMDVRKGTPSGGTVTTASIVTPALSAAQVASGTGLSLAVAAGDVLELVITGTPVSVTAANLTLKLTR